MLKTTQQKYPWTRIGLNRSELRQPSGNFSAQVHLVFRESRPVHLVVSFASVPLGTKPERYCAGLLAAFGFRAERGAPFAPLVDAAARPGEVVGGFC